MAKNTSWENDDDLYEVKKYIGRVVQKWYIVIGLLLLSLFVAYLFNRYEAPVYMVNATFITKKFDESNTGGLAGIMKENAFRQRIEVNQEIPLLKSQDKIEETLRRLNFDISYFIKGRFITSEVYENFNYTVTNFSKPSHVFYESPIFIEDEGNNSYKLRCESTGIQSFFSNKSFQYGKKQEINGWKFSITKNAGQYQQEDYAYYFKINNPASLLNEYRSKLDIAWTERGSAILRVAISSEIPQKDYEFLNTYLQVVVEKGLEEKNQYLVNTIDFINEYMVFISDTLFKYQSRIDNFRLHNREIINGSSYLFDRLKTLDQEKTEYLLQNRYYDYIQRYIKQNKYEEVFAPDLIGLEAPLLDDLVNNYIQAKWKDKVNLNDANSKNPLVSKSNEQFDRLEKNIYESIRSLKSSNQEKINEINQQVSFYYNSIDEFQVESREYSEVNRMLNTYEGLFNTLLSKRTDAYITKSSTTSDYQIVTPPYYSKKPIYPDKNQNYWLGLGIGLAIPLALIFLVNYFNGKIIGKDDLQKNTNIPIIGNIGHSGSETNFVVQNKPKSLVSESFRGIRANLQYFSNGNKANQVFLITSSISSEGKTFCSINLAYSYAMSGKKTVLIGADMRKPTLAKNFSINKEDGLSNYLAGMAELKDIVYSTEREDLSVIPSGKIPPDPAELLGSKRMSTLMEELRSNYDIIIFDTPPIGLVADTLEILNYSDTNLLIVRQGKTYKKSLISITELYNDQKIEHLGIIFNDINFSKYEYGDYGKNYGYGYGYGYSYGYGYGYGYYDEDEKTVGWFRKLMTKKWFKNRS